MLQINALDAKNVGQQFTKIRCTNHESLITQDKKPSLCFLYKWPLLRYISVMECDQFSYKP